MSSMHFSASSVVISAVSAHLRPLRTCDSRSLRALCASWTKHRLGHRQAAGLQLLQEGWQVAGRLKRSLDLVGGAHPLLPVEEDVAEGHVVVLIEAGQLRDVGDLAGAV